MRIYLIGFMGCGKTHWGKIWAEEKKYFFYDVDDSIEKAEGETIEMIFEKKGEAYFRKIESAMLRTTIDFENCIISCGGGTPCHDDNIQWMNNNGITIYLQSNPSQLLENILSETNKRPLIKNMDQTELLEFIENKLSERNIFYNQASLITDVSMLDKNSMDKFTGGH